MRGVERISQPDQLAAAVYAQIHSIIGVPEPLPDVRQNNVRHVSVEDAMRELLEMQQISAEHPPASSQ